MGQGAALSLLAKQRCSVFALMRVLYSCVGACVPQVLIGPRVSPIGQTNCICVGSCQSGACAGELGALHKVQVALRSNMFTCPQLKDRSRLSKVGATEERRKPTGSNLGFKMANWCCCSTQLFFFFFHFRQLAKVKPLLSQPHEETLIHRAFVTSRPDYSQALGLRSDCRHIRFKSDSPHI